MAPRLVSSSLPLRRPLALIVAAALILDPCGPGWSGRRRQRTAAEDVGHRPGAGSEGRLETCRYDAWVNGVRRLCATARARSGNSAGYTRENHIVSHLDRIVLAS